MFSPKCYSVLGWVLFLSGVARAADLAGKLGDDLSELSKQIRTPSIAMEVRALGKQLTSGSVATQKEAVDLLFDIRSQLLLTDAVASNQLGWQARAYAASSLLALGVPKTPEFVTFARDQIRVASGPLIGGTEDVAMRSQFQLGVISLLEAATETRLELEIDPQRGLTKEQLGEMETRVKAWLGNHGGTDAPK